MEQHLLAWPIVGQYKFTTIRTCIILCLTDIRRIALESCRPCITNILVDSVSVSVQFKQSWDWKIFPLWIVIPHTEEVCRGILMVLHKTETPQALHRQITLRGFLLAHSRQLLTFVSKEVCTSRLTVLLVDLRITPFWCCLCLRCSNRH